MLPKFNTFCPLWNTEPTCSFRVEIKTITYQSAIFTRKWNGLLIDPTKIPLRPFTHSHFWRKRDILWLFLRRKDNIRCLLHRNHLCIVPCLIRSPAPPTGETERPCWKTNDQPLKAFQFRPTPIQSIEGEGLQGNEYLSIIVKINPFFRRKMLVEPDWCTPNKLTKDLLSKLWTEMLGVLGLTASIPQNATDPKHNKKLVARGTSPCSTGGEKADLDLISKTRSTQCFPAKPCLEWRP